MLLLAGAPARADAPAAAGEADLRGRIAAVLADHGVPGAGIVLVGQGAPQAFGVGLADPHGGRPVEADTLFRVGSVSKSVTALAVMRMVEQGGLSLRDQVRTLAPEVSFANPWEADHPVRVENLLEHTTGWEFLHYVEEWEDAPAPRPLLEVIQRSPESRRCRWPPGAYASYSNEGYLVAGFLVEKLSGVPFDQAVRGLVLDPLGMQDSAFRLDPARAGRLAVGTRRGRPVAYREDGIRPAAGMVTSPRDMARWLTFWVNRGSDGSGPVSSSTIARIEQARSLEIPGPDLLYGLGNEAADIAGVAVRGHDGFTDGFTASFHYAPAEAVGWAVLLNGESVEALAQIEAAIVTSLGLYPPAAAASAETRPAALADVAGWYQEVTPARSIWAPLGAVGGWQVSVREGSLLRRCLEVTRPVDLFRADGWQRLEPLGDGRFTVPGSGAAAGIRFVRRGADTLMVEELGAWKRVDWRWAGLRRLALAAALSLLGTSLLCAPAALLWMTRSRGVAPHALPLAALAVLTLVCARLLISKGSGHLATPSAVSVAIFALSLAFAALALATPAAAYLDLRRAISPVVKVYQLLLGLACLGLALWGWRAGWIALRTWTA